MAASSKAAGDPGAAAAASAATQATSDAKAAAEESAQAAANAAGLATSVATPASATLCIPMYSRFHVESVVAGTTTPKTGAADAKNAGAKTTNSADNKSETAAANSQIIKGSFSSKAHLFHKSALPFAPVKRSVQCYGISETALSYGTLPEKSDKKVTCNGSFDPDTIVDYDIPYEFTSDDFQKVRSQRMGFTWGGLVVPYKFYVSDRSFQTNTSTVGYVGYEGYFPGVSLAGIVALGPGFASTNQIQPAATPGGTPTTKTTTSATYTAATGLVTTFGGVMKLGLVVGWDWQGRAVGFKYEGKTWVAVSIGAGF